MRAKLFTTLIGMILKLLTPELLKQAMDTMLNFIEDKVLYTDNKVDDALVLPLCKLIRATFDIPDND